jgi:hypothetical protein
VTDVGAAGRARDQRTSTSPIFGSRSRPSPSTRNRELAVNRTDCLRSFLDRNRGGATLRAVQVRAVAVTKLHTTSIAGFMATDIDISANKHLIVEFNAYLAFVAKYRHAVFAGRHLARLEETR